MTSKEKIIVINRKRGSLKSQITKISAFLDDETEKDKIALETKLENLHKIKFKLGEIKNEYFEVVVNDADLEPLESSVTELEDDCEKLEVRIKRIILTSSNEIALNDFSNSEITTKLDCVNIKLPEIPLPKFSGQYQEWHTFKNQFENLIHVNNKLTDTQKLYYLKSTLIGPAADIVTLDDSYLSLFKALTDRFENKRLIVNSHFNEILSLDIPFQESAKGLRLLVDVCQKHIRALKTIGLEINQFSEALLINIVLKKLDKESRKQFELSLLSTELPDWNNFIDFLEKRCLMLENIQTNVAIPKPKTPLDRNQKSKSFFVKNNQSTLCVMCKKPHPIYKCESFLKLDELARFDIVKKNNLCINCLSNQHRIAQCLSTRVCNTCALKHNSLLHRKINKPQKNITTGVIENSSQTQTDKSQQKLKSSENDELDLSLSLCSRKEKRAQRKNNNVLLSTCVLFIKNAAGQKVAARAILDSGSQSSFITTELSNNLGIKKIKHHASISSINGYVTQLYSKICANISNQDESYSRTVDLLITPKITDWVPSHPINIKELNLPSDIIISDKKFGEPNEVQILIGAQFFYELLEVGKYRVNNLIFQNTVFGYIASGTVEGKCNQQYCGLVSSNSINQIENLVEKFWQIENVDVNDRHLSDDAIYCEEHFKLTHKRNADGRYIVKMPMKDEFPLLGESKHIAEKRLDSLNKRLEKSTHLQKLYSDFIEEYETLDHMERVVEDVLPCNNYYLPHHGVYRPEKTTTPLRVVFNASSPSSNGISLNDVLLKGDVVEDILELMIRFRTHKFAFTADVQKMFRQILIAPSQRDYLRILWIDQITKQPITYRLKTVTYGTASAPFLAIRTLKQLAEDESSKFPLAAEIAMRDFYMDDVISGANDLESAQILQHQLNEMLHRGGMTLHKWTSNSTALLNSSPSLEQERSIPIDEHTTVKTLGMNWLHIDDNFVFRVDYKEEPYYTKKSVLSVIARLYDPLGLLGPIICKAKIFMQKLWLQQLGWEDQLPEAIADEWKYLVTSLKGIEQIKIPRWILVDNPQKIILNCFADASEVGYGTVIYIQCIMPNNTATSRLVTSKSRVAPLKVISIPRLELCACLLASQLKTKVEQSLNLQIDSIVMYTDSTISLAWIQTKPHQLKTFVANRVVKIQRLSQNCTWLHIPSKLNPADVLSRGVLPEQLVNDSLWWNGPSFLQEPVPFCSTDQKLIDPSAETQFLCELKGPIEHNLVTIKSDFLDNFLNLSNSYSKLINVFSFILRFIGNCKNQTKMSGPLTANEIALSEVRLISLIQQESLAEDFERLSSGRDVATSSKLKFLSPFLDKSTNVIRVGGRLKNSDLPYDAKHPIVLPKDHILSKLIMLHIHNRNCHIGAQTLLHLTRQNFWPIGGRNLARSIIHNCVICTKHNPQFSVQKMGDLPGERCKPSFPFNTTGVDFCGPFYIKNKFQRKGPLQKIYVSIFICFVTRAVHFEIVSDLTSDSFIAALKRFMSRRGKIATIFTDNGLNFVGSNNELKRLFKLVSQPDNVLAKYFSSEGIRWNFIPPRSPHFGGLWEAGVKSFKFHLSRAVGNLKFTFEEFLTITNQIEGILNSRPIVPLSSDPNELQALTPAHFLIGRPILTIIEPNLTELSDNALKRWQRITKITQYVWTRWHRDYLNHLQQRNKWYFAKDNISEGTMVVVKEDNMPLNSWLMGRVEKVFYGKDKMIRVCLVRTKFGVFKRPITKLAVLPIPTE